MSSKIIKFYLDSDRLISDFYYMYFRLMERELDSKIKFKYKLLVDSYWKEIFHLIYIPMSSVLVSFQKEEFLFYYLIGLLIFYIYLLICYFKTFDFEKENQVKAVYRIIMEYFQPKNEKEFIKGVNILLDYDITKFKTSSHLKEFYLNVLVLVLSFGLNVYEVVVNPYIVNNVNLHTISELSYKANNQSINLYVMMIIIIFLGCSAIILMQINKRKYIVRFQQILEDLKLTSKSHHLFKFLYQELEK